MYIVNLPNLKVSNIMVIEQDNQDVWICGSAQKIDDNQTGWYHYMWRAKPLIHGYLVEIIAPNGRKKQFQGSTFNLTLEVSTAINRAI